MGAVDIDHVALFVTDMALARRILEQGFGLGERRERRVEGPPMQVSIMAGTHMFVELLALSPDQMPATHPLAPHLAFRVDDLQETVRRLRAFDVRWQGDEPMRVGDTINVWSDPATSAGMVIQLVCPS